jgi:hypothetical protein
MKSMFIALVVGLFSVSTVVHAADTTTTTKHKHLKVADNSDTTGAPAATPKATKKAKKHAKKTTDAAAPAAEGAAPTPADAPK